MSHTMDISPVSVPQPQKSFIRKYALPLILALFAASIWAGWTLGRMLVPENISPVQKELRAHYQTNGIKISGGTVRNESSFVVSQGIFTVKQNGEKYVFFTNDCVTEEDAKKRLVELSPFVSADRMIRNGSWVLYLSNDWQDPHGAVAQKVKNVFMDFHFPSDSQKKQ